MKLVAGFQDWSWVQGAEVIPSKHATHSRMFRQIVLNRGDRTPHTEINAKALHMILNTVRI